MKQKINYKKEMEDYKKLLNRALFGWSIILYEWKKTIIISAILYILWFLMGLIIGGLYF